MVKVALLHCEDYNETMVFSSVNETLNLLGGLDKFVAEGQKVLVKPNMLAAALPEEAVCTHPLVVKAVLKLILQLGAHPVVGDSPAVGSTEKVAQKNGIAQVCSELNVPLVSFDNPQEIVFNAGHVCKKFLIDKAVIDADVIINVPKLKTHGLTSYTGGVKNLFGCIPGKNKAQFHLRMPNHLDFSAMLVDLYTLVKPQLILMDGVIGMEGAGPRNGKPRKIGALLASTSSVALDFVAASIIGMNPLDVPTTKAALSRGIDVHSSDDITIAGAALDGFIIKNFAHTSAFTSLSSMPRPLMSFLQNRLVAKPHIGDKCIGCGICKESCPPQVIKLENKKAVISYDKCIRCYCCQELCPHDAIELKKGKLGQWLFKK